MPALELRVPPPIVALVFGLAMWLAAGVGPSLALPLAARVTAFAVVALVGGAVAFAGSLEFRRARTTVNPLAPQNATVLVTTGIYRYTRNPMYLGLALVVLGWAAFLASAVALLGPIAFVSYISRFQITPEERVLSVKFGDAYAAFTSRVRRWF